MTHFRVIVAIGPKGDVEKLVSEQLDPYDENGEWFADGSRWDWWVIGGRFSNMLLGRDIIQVKQVFDLEKEMREESVCRARERWHQAQGEDEVICSLVYGIDKETSLRELLEKAEKAWFPVGKFVHKHHWHEADRAGWWGGTTATECEVRGKETQRCRWKDQKTEALITVWNESDEDWGTKFVDRFLRPLPPETRLVMVDCHV